MNETEQGKIACLDVYSWQGLSLGAEHYYGELYINDEKIDMVNKLTASGAAKLNKKAGCIAYKPGNEVKNFDTEEQVIALAIEEFKKRITNGVLLIGKSVRLEPQRCVFTVGEYEGFMEKANELHEAYEKVPWNEYDDALAQAWCDLLDDYNLEDT